MRPTYFTCTLGQAAALNLTDKSFENINQFIASWAKNTPALPAVGFANPSSIENETWKSSTWTFSEVYEGTQALAALLKEEHGELLEDSKTVALICPSTPEFLFIWLALMRLGRAVLLIAPQCQPAAIAHLCKACDVTVIFHDEFYASQSHEAAQEMEKDGAWLNTVPLPFTKDRNLAYVFTHCSKVPFDAPVVRDTDVAYLHHTSGTSSGVPKPIPQSHRAGAGVLPAFPDGNERASFTTTPLYHGGVADLLRAWSSGALIWLFPGKGVPITANNVVKCLDTGAEGAKKLHLPPIKYFSSVPYVLQMMEANVQGLRYLQSMDIVGVGGAALPEEVGDRMVRKGVNLISRFGSAECGFLMSSHRDYEKDSSWQHLRSNEGAEFLRFEPRDGGLVELVIEKGWPHMAKTNREDGSFATADLFAPHKELPNAWRYDSRADSQLTLITGKKFDPAPLEGAMATSDLLDDVLIFGNGKPFPGALLFRTAAAQQISDPELCERIWPQVEKLNSESQDHARILRKMLVAMPMLDTPLEKSSKGTIIRGATETRFAETIENAYTDMSSINIGDDVADDDVPHVLKKIIESIVPRKRKLELDTELFSYGVDSVAGMQVRYGMRQLLPQSAKQLPLNVVEDCGTVARLAEYVIKQRHGQELDDDEDEHELMRRLVDQYSKFEQRPNESVYNGDSGHAKSPMKNQNKEADGDKDVIVLTGATGALGAHILALYLNMDHVSKIYCLVRGADTKEASRKRVSESLEQRGLPRLSPTNAKVEVLDASLGDSRLGLSDQDYKRIAAEVSIVMHVAWSVNFRMRLRSFVEDNIAGVTNLINLALASSRSTPARFAFCSSIASVLAYDGSKAMIPEEIIDDPSVSTDLGYSRSKWVAEQLCARAGENTPLHGNIAVFRVGQLSGDSSRGIWNIKEAWPMMLSSVKLTRTLPALEGEALDWLPVDIAAVALTQGIDGLDGSGENISIMHVLNENRGSNWADLLSWLKTEMDFDAVSPTEWVARLEDAQQKDGADHPAFKLLDLWKKAYSVNGILTGGHDQENTSDAKIPGLDKTKRLIPVLRDVRPVDQKYFLKVWHWVDANM